MTLAVPTCGSGSWQPRVAGAAPLGGRPQLRPTYHLRWVAAPRKDRTLRPALDLAQTMAEQDFDRKRPLWEMTLMTGLAKGQAALIIKIHHAITDGIGGLAMGAAMLDLARESDVDLGDKPDAPSGEALGLSQRLTSGVSYEAKRFATTSRAAVTGLGDLALRTVKDPRGTASDAAAFVSSASRLLAPAGVPESPLMTARSLSGDSTTSTHRSTTSSGPPKPTAGRSTTRS